MKIFISKRICKWKWFKPSNISRLQISILFISKALYHDNTIPTRPRESSIHSKFYTINLIPELAQNRLLDKLHTRAVQEYNIATCFLHSIMDLLVNHYCPFILHTDNMYDTFDDARVNLSYVIHSIYNPRRDHSTLIELLYIKIYHE